MPKDESQPTLEPQSPPTLLYRGVDQDHDRNRMGAWWSTNPYYGFRYSGAGRGEMFVASVGTDTFREQAKDASLEADYENYTFPDDDPPNARPVTAEEIEKLKAATTFMKDELGGGMLMAWPDNAIEIGQSIFGTKYIGTIAISSELENTAPEIPLEIQVKGVDPAIYAPASASPYLGTAKRGPNIYESPDEATEAIEYAKELFPDREFSFLGSGRYGIVLADETGKAFKVYRTASRYSQCEREAGALKVLSDAGLAPKLHLFVDAGEEYRLDKKAYDYTKKGFEDEEIPRQNSQKPLPILIMDRVKVAPLASADQDKIADGFCKLAELFIEENIYSWDGEVVLDQTTGEIVMIDVGQLSQIPFDALSATPKAKLDHDSQILRDLTLEFRLTRQDEIVETYHKGGLDAVHELIANLNRLL